MRKQWRKKNAALRKRAFDGVKTADRSKRSEKRLLDLAVVKMVTRDSRGPVTAKCLGQKSDCEV